MQGITVQNSSVVSQAIRTPDRQSHLHNTPMNNNDDNNHDNKKEDAVGPSHVSNDDSDNERVTRKGRRLARQGQTPASSTSSTGTRPGAKSSDNTRANTPNTTFFQHRVVNQPGRPEGSGYWQLTERTARQQRLQRHRREAAAAASANNNTSHGAQVETATDSPNVNPELTSSPSVVMGELVIDSLPENSLVDKKKRRRRLCLCCAILFVPFLVVIILAVSLPFVLMERSDDNRDRGNEEPLPRPTDPPPVLRRTFAPSVTPGVSFVKFGDDIEEEGLERFGYSVAFVGERWVAVSAPATGSGAGLVRVLDIYNRSQIGQDMVGTIGNNQFGVALSGTDDFLAVASTNLVWLVRYNETGRQWDRVGPILDPSVSFTDPSIARIPLLQIGELSMDQLSTSTNTTLIRLTVTFWTSRADKIVFALFTMDVSQPSPVWVMIGNSILLEDAALGTAAGFVGDNALVGGVAGQSVTATRAFLLQGDVWVEQTNFTVPESVSSTSQLLSTSFFHTTNSTVVAYTYRADSSGIPTITVVEVGPDLSVTQKGSPIRYLGNDPPEWSLTNVVVHGDWLVGGRFFGGNLVGVVYRLEEGDWVKQGNDFRVSFFGLSFDRIVMALSSSSLYDNVESPTVVAGLIVSGQQRYPGFARLFRARGDLS